MTTSLYTQQLDVRRITAADLPKLDDEEFRQVVDAEARSQRNRDLVHSSIPAALRSPDIVERWFAALSRMAKSVDGQLGTRADEYDAKRSALRADLFSAQRDLLNASGSAEKKQAKNRIALLQSQIEALRADYMQQRARTMRFKSGLDETLLEARHLRDVARGNVYESVIAEERNWHAARSQRLESAIRDHRLAAEAGDLEPEPHDLALWTAIERR